MLHMSGDSVKLGSYSLPYEEIILSNQILFFFYLCITSKKQRSSPKLQVFHVKNNLRITLENTRSSPYTLDT